MLRKTIPALGIDRPGRNWPAKLVERPSMGIAFVSTERKISAFVAAALLLSSLSLGERATATAGSALMDARAQAAPPKTSIFDPPPKPEKPAMTAAERLKMQKELNAARDRQEEAGKARVHAPPTKSVKP
jgi:hypothetical protein